VVVRTETCAFSELKVYPGHGRRFVTRSGQMVILVSSKVDSMYHQRKKSAKLMWTQAWRRMHKKINVEASAKRRVRKVIKDTRFAAGVNMAKVEENRKAAELRKAAVPAKPADGAKAAVVLQASVADAKAKKKAMQEKRKKAAASSGPKPVAAAKHAGKGR